MRKTDSLPRYLTYLFLALVLSAVAYARIRLLSVPLERDEGEFAYMGQLLLKGIPPFVSAYTMKLPGVSMAYALFMLLFGQTAVAIRIGLLIVNGCCISLVYLLTRRFFDRKAALLSCASFAALSLSESVFGIFAHATHFVILFVLAGFLLLFRFFDKGKISRMLLSGLFFGMAFLMKQHAAPFIVYAFICLAVEYWRNTVYPRKQLLTADALFLTGMLLPYGFIALWMARAGAFEAFWFWTVQYAREYAAGPTLSQGATELASAIFTLVTAQPLLWFLAVSGGILLCTKYSRSTGKPFIFGFLVASFLATCPGLVFREHYFVMLLPAVALLIGAFVNSAHLACAASISPACNRFIPVPLLVAAIAFGFYHERQYLFRNPPEQVSRTIYGANPFPEAQHIASYLKERTAPGDRIAVLGSEPEIFFYADRLSATGYLYMYGLMENQPYAERMQLQMIREIETTRPKYAVIVNVSASWLVTPASRKTVLVWGEQYVKDRYDLVGVIDIIGPETTRYVWGKEAKSYNPVSESYVTVFARKE